MKWIAITLIVAGCGNSGPREPDEYTGCGSDENWRTFDDQEKSSPVIGDATAPNVTMPSSGAMIASAQKPKLTWQQDPNDVGAPDGDVPYMGAGCNNCCPQFNLGALQTLHLPPISGDVYDLQFTVGGKLAWRVVTTLQEWTPRDTTWASWRGKSVSLKLWRMSLLRNDVKQGPYTATQPFTFTVGN